MCGAVDVDGVDGHVHGLAATVLGHLGLVKVVGWEVERVARVGEVAIVVDRADGDVQKTCGGGKERLTSVSVC